MDAGQEARCKEMLDQILAMAAKMASDLEACNSAFRTAPPAFVIDSNSSRHEVDPTTSTGYNFDDLASNLVTAPSASLTPSPTSAPFKADDRANSTTSNLVTAASASPAPSPTFAPSQDVALDSQIGITELLMASPTRCSTLSLYRYACIPVSIALSSAPSTVFSISTLLEEVVLAIPMVATMIISSSSLGIDNRYESCISSESYLGPYGLQDGCAAPRHKAADHAKLSHDVVREADKILQDSNDIGNGRGCRQPKPPWLLGTDAFRSWSGKMQLISGFLLEVSPWCRDYIVWVQWQPSVTPPVQLMKASRGTNLQLLLCLFAVCTRAEAKQSKFLLVLMFDICYIELPIVHSNFQLHILVFEVLPVKPKVSLYFICRTGGSHSVFLMHKHPLLLDLVEDVQAALLLMMPVWPSPTISEPWPPCVSDVHVQRQQTSMPLMKQMFNRGKWKISFVSNYDGKELMQLKTPWLLFVCRNRINCCLARNLMTDTVITSIASGALLEVVKFKSSDLFISNTNALMVLLDSARLQLVWHFSETKQYISPLAFESWILETHSLEGMGPVLPWYQQYTIFFHLLADTRRTMLHFNQDKQLKHYGMVPQPTHPLSFLLASYKIGQSVLVSKIGDSTLWTSPQGHTDAQAIDVNWSFNCAKSSFEERRKWWPHQMLIVVLWTSIIKGLQVILWDPGAAKPLTIRLVVFLLQPCSPCRWYKKSNRCCITDSFNYCSSRVLAPCQNIGSETTFFLNASMQQILLQDSEARVQGSQLGHYMCYLKQLNDEWCHGRFTLSIMSVRVTWDPGGLKFVRGFHATAWGQAVFQGGENVMILLEILWVRPMKRYMGWTKIERRQCLNMSLGLAGSEDGINTQHHQQEEASDDQTTEPAAASTSSSRGER